MRFLLALLPALLLAPTGTPAAKPEPCPGGRYLVEGDPLVPGAAVAVDVVEVGSTAAIESGCGPVPVKLKGKKKGTKLKVRFTACEGVEGKARLVATIEPTCTTMTGTFRAKKAKLKRQFTATLDTNLPPEASFTASSASIAAGTPLAFSASGTDPDGDPVTFSWRFGDGGMGGGEDIAHVFASAGSFDVALTAADGRGGTDTAQQTIEVTPGPQPSGAVTATGTVKDTDGAALAGVSVVVVGEAGSGTTDSGGAVSIAVPIGAPGLLRLTKDGYADQVVVIDAPAGAESAIFQAEMQPREAPLTLASAQAGGTLAGKDGATIIVPPASLVNESGTPVTGAVQVSMSPVDPTTDPDAFPGVYGGVTPAAEQGLLLSYGTVEYALSQGGQDVNLAPGAKATIEIPAYGDALKDGTPIAPGSTMPLWSLDERTGAWVQEGIGTIVASAASPTGLALRGEVTHFSWWNCDAFERPPYNPKPRCLVDTDHDGNLEDLTGTGYCWHYGTGPDQPPFGAGGGAGGSGPRLPQYAAEIMLPPSGGVILPVPANYDITLRSTAKAGTLVATTILNGPAGLEEDIDILLEEVDPSAAVPITVPWDQTYTIDAVTEADQYVFTATLGDPIYVTVSREGSTLAGNVFVDGPGGFESGPDIFGSSVSELGFLAPASGEYRISVEGTSGAPGTYRLQVQPTGTFPLLISTTPADGATGISPATTIGATFTAAIDPATVNTFSFWVRAGGLSVAGTYAVAGNVITFTPDAALPVGTPHTVTLSTEIRSLEGAAFPSEHTFAFSTADVVGAPAYLGAGFRPQIAPLPNGEALVVYEGSSPDRAVATRYVPGEGWSVPSVLSTANAGLGTKIASNAAGQAIAIWHQTDTVGPAVQSIWAAHFTPATGWGAALPIEDVAANMTGFGNASGDFKGMELALDDAGNAIAIFSESTQRLYWNRYTAGVGWGTATVLVDPAGAYVADTALSMNAAGQAFFVTIESPVGGSLDAMARRFTPGGAWEAPEPIEDSGVAPIDARVAIDADGNAMALWRQSGVYVARRYDAGDAEWSDNTETIQNDSSGASLATDDDAEIAFAADGRALAVGHAVVADHLVWAAEYEPGPGGTEGTWTTGTILDTVWPTGGPNFAINGDGDGIAVWAAQPGVDETRYKRYVAGVGWDASYALVPGLTDTDNRPWAVATESGTLFAVSSFFDGVSNTVVVATRIQ